jgi:hypothetical protein
MFDPRESGWTALREPTPDRFLVCAMLLSVPLLAPGLLLLPQLVQATWFAPAVLVAFVGSLLLMILIHEVMHALCYPGGLRSPHVCLGVWPSRMTFYASYDGPMSRDRFLLVLAAPAIVLSMLMLPAMIWALPTWRTVATATFLIHLACCTGDLLGIWMVARQVPRTAQVQNDGWATYWQSALRA